MTRVLDALKALEKRRQANASDKPCKPAAAAPIEPRPATAILQLREEAAASSVPAVEAASEITRRAARAHAVANMCLLPTVPVVADHYHELAERIGEQLSTNYCNVILLVSPDDTAELGFSMTHLAQAFSLQSVGDVLLVDGDLARGRLSKSVCPAGPGIAEAMQGLAQWTEIIHSTTTPRIDFVGRGECAMPAHEPLEFGWVALRPKYRAVLIGVAQTSAPQTAWLAAHCDAVYVLISRPNTQRDVAQAAVESLRTSGANLMGSILIND
ncbi:MAG: hypothetical protein AB7O59_11600 [Pirellulales bacterium]